MIIDVLIIRTAAGAMRARCRCRRRRPGAGRAASSGSGCSSPEKRSHPRSAIPSACTSWRSRTRRTFTCGRRSKATTQDVRLVILRTARYDDAAEEVEFGEISIFLAPTFVITVRQGAGQRAARCQAAARAPARAAGGGQRIRAVGDPGPGGGRLRTGGRRARARYPPHRGHRFSGAAAPTERIYSLRREATDFYRAVHPLLAVVTTVEREAQVPSCTCTSVTSRTTCC